MGGGGLNDFNRALWYFLLQYRGVLKGGLSDFNRVIVVFSTIIKLGFRVLVIIYAQLFP